MQQGLGQLLELMRQGMGVIFQIVESIWVWSVAQIMTLANSHWHDWPLWKQAVLVLIAVGVIWALYRAIWELWVAGERILAGIVALFGALVRTIPSMVLAGLISLGGVWILNNVDPATLHMPAFLQLSQK